MMASHFAKRPSRPDEYRRPSIWRFMTTTRLGHRGRRSSADDGSNLPFEQTNNSGASLASSDEEDGDSLGSRYSDAQSSWSNSSVNREEAISQALSDLLQADMHDRLSDRALEHELQPASSRDAHDLSSEVAVSRSRDDVVSIEGVSTHIQVRNSQASPVASQTHIHTPIPAGVQASQGLYHDQEPTQHTAGDDRNMPDNRKGKNVENLSSWSATMNPWSLLEGCDQAPEITRRDLLDENTRLRAEIQELKRLAGSKAQQSDAVYTTPSSPQHPSVARSLSKPSRSRQRRWPDVALFDTTTLRDLILKRLFTPHVITRGVTNYEGHPITLDTPLTPMQILEFTRIMNDVIVSGSHLKQPIALCAVCHLPKFKRVKGTCQNSYVSEVLEQLPTVSAAALEDFDPIWGTSGCCRRYVCKTCLSAAIMSGIDTQWWFNLTSGGTNWLKCPVPCCGRNLPLHSRDEVCDVLQKLGVPVALPHVKRFERANTLRSELRGLDTVPGKEQIRRSKALHDRLVRNNMMLPLLEEEVPRNDASQASKPVYFPVDTADGRSTLQVPVFSGLLQPRVPRTCLVCDETYPEFDRGDLQRWTRIVRGFGGEWTWRVLSFPAPEILSHCHHVLEICRDCLRKHVAARLETQGHGAVDNITCPQPGCNHRYLHTEIRVLASPEIFVMYDRYTVLNSISPLPNFRWCLREGCVSGGLYDDPSSPTVSVSPSPVDRNYIQCSECNFTMCYSCQSPWHAGLTCAQNSSQNDASFTETRTWLAQHTKPCPGDGCGVQVQKGDGCFHMTCSRCRFEFCWECLADWREIFVPSEGGGFLKVDGHREGCFFRTDDAPLPTQVMGQDLETGLRRLQQQEAAAAVVVG